MPRTISGLDRYKFLFTARLPVQHTSVMITGSCFNP